MRVTDEEVEAEGLRQGLQQVETQLTGPGAAVEHDERSVGRATLPVEVVIVSLLVMVSGVAVTTHPTTTFALAGYPNMAGTASSLLGMARFAFGGAAAPLVGIAGAGTMLPFGIVTVAGIALAAASVALLARRRDVTEPDATDLRISAADALAPAVDR